MTVWFFLIGCIAISSDLCCHPVPNPGNSTGDISVFVASKMRQTILLEYATAEHGRVQGEGCCGTTSATEASQWEREFIDKFANCGNPLPMDSGPQQRALRPTQVQKRSFRRACARALRHGATWYKGRICSVSDFPLELRHRLQAQPTDCPRLTSLNAAPHRAARLRLLNWNPGGMAQGKLAELRLWLRTHPYDVVVIPETRWGFQRCWTDDQWHYLHSATNTPRTGGILIMIAKRLIASEHIGFEEVVPGRVLHARLHFHKISADLIAIYQHAEDSTSQRLLQRTQLWDQLDEYLYQLPVRNQLICCGDFNCALPCAPPWVGTGTFRWMGSQCKGHQHRDMARFLQLLQRHALTALNSWSSAIGPSFFHGEYAARIDYFLIRLQCSDGIAKQSHYLHDADFLPINQTHHFPLECTIRKHHTSFHQHKYVPACNYQQRALCRQDSLQESDAWLRLSRHVAFTCQDMPLEASLPPHCVSGLHQAIIPFFHQLYPSKAQRNAAPTSDSVAPVIHNKWGHRRCIRAISHAHCNYDLGACLQVWFHWSRFRILQKMQQRQIRQARRQRFNALCEEATIAADQIDAHSLFQIINRYSPKRPLVKARIKTADGKIADQLTIEHITNTWQGNEDLQPLTEVTPGVPISILDIEQAIMQLHPNKAVAYPFLPAVVLKSAPRELAKLIYQWLNTWWNCTPPFIPQEWRDAWLFFLPKPGKPGTHPSQLRPISLMEPVGKMVLGLLTHQLKIFHLKHLCSQPHFGFLPQRDAIDAVARVANHCNRVRTLVCMQKRTVARQIAGQPLYTFCGGLQMFLDLRHAFDSVNRTLLFQHLQSLGTPDVLLQLISTWHMNTHYNLVFNGKTTTIPVNIGLRQGCKAAPLLWVLFMDRFLHLLSEKVDTDWIAEAVTLYADDIHVGTVFHSNAEYRQCLHRLGCVLDAVEELQLALSYEKTFIIMATAGTNVSRGVKGTIQRTKHGAFLMLPRASQQSSAIPLRARGKYLGTELSYGQYELQTWQQRLKAARSAFARLKCWFKGRHFKLEHRIHLWKVCVHTILTYGLCATNLTVRILTEFQQNVYQMMRTVLHDHSYHTKRTHQQVFAAHGIDQPLQLLAQHVARAWQRIQRRALALPATDFLHRVDWSHLPELLKLIHCVADSTVTTPIADDGSVPVQTQAIFQCDECEFQTASIPNLRRHMTTFHGISQFRTSALPPLTMALRGKPQCKGCHMAFTSWRRFFIHVERNCCQVFANSSSSMQPAPISAVETQMEPPPEVDMMPRSAEPVAVPHIRFAAAVEPFWPLLLQIAQTSEYSRLLEDANIGASMSHHCIICGTWCNRCQEMNLHYRLHHSSEMHGALARSAQISHLMPTDSPCPLCQKAYRRGHCCSVATQLAVLQLHHMAPEERRHACRTCIICNQTMDTMCQLHQHLAQQHDIQVHDWCPARDSLMCSTACAHCGAIFESRSGLQRHILDGRCTQFNPEASPQTLDFAQKWMKIMRQGDLSRFSLTPGQRQDLTLVCQLCGTRYGRQNDLGAHLQQAHSPLWMASQEMLRFLIQTVQACQGCQCNPTCNDQGKTHICMKFRQFAMMYLSSECDLLVPAQFTNDMLDMLMAHITHLPLSQLLRETLHARHFDKLWQSPGLAGLLKQWCVLCSDQFHPAELVVHHWQRHGDQSQWATQIKFQITACLLRLQDNDTRCNFCGIMINPPLDTDSAATPDRLLTMQTHFASNCPIAHQAALLLQPIHGREHGLGSVRPGAAGIVQATGAFTPSSQSVQKRKRRGAPIQTPQTGGVRRRRDATQSTADTTCHAGHDEAHGGSSSAARKESTASQSSGLLRFLCPGQPTRRSPSAHPVGSRVEGPAQTESGCGETPNNEDVSPEGSHQRGPSESAEDGIQQTGRRSVGQSSPNWCASEGRGLDLSEMESRGETADSTRQGTSLHEQSPTSAAAPGGALGRLHSCGEISLTEGSAHRDTLVSSVVHETGRGMAHPCRDATAGSMEPTWPVAQGSQPIPMPPSAVAPAMSATSCGNSQEPGQREEQWEIPPTMNPEVRRHQLRSAFRRLTLDNGDNLCYANSGLLAFLWAMLSRVTFTDSDWGEYSELFGTFLMTYDTAPVLVSQFPWFQRLLNGWSDRHGQADGAEFSSLLLRVVAPRCCSNRWERRVSHEQKTDVHDRGDAHMPITLQLDMELLDNGSIRLNDLIRHWHQELGMSAGLVDSTELVCLHLDRFVLSPVGQLRKMHVPIGFLWSVDVPTLTDGINCTWHGYQVVAAFAHSGDASSGHYQALLRVGNEALPHQTPALWLHCDDNRAPRPCWHMPPEFASEVTCFWLCRCEQLELHNMRLPCPDMLNTAPAAADVTTQAMMTMLHSLPTESR